MLRLNLHTAIPLEFRRLIGKLSSVARYGGSMTCSVRFLIDPRAGYDSRPVNFVLPNWERLLMTRWTASSLHLAISLALGLAFVALTRLVWYPGPLFDVSGAVGLLTILIPADIVLGPLLTLLVFKPGKPSLRFDLTVIALVQTAAMFYGAWTIAEVRPAYVVLIGNQLKVVRSMDLAEKQPWQTPLTGPQWVAVPTEGAIAAEIADAVARLSGKKTAALDPTQYQPWSGHQEAFDAALQSVREVQPAAASNQLVVVLTEAQWSLDQVLVMPITVRDQSMTAVFEVKERELVAILPVPLLARR